MERRHPCPSSGHFRELWCRRGSGGVDVRYSHPCTIVIRILIALPERIRPPLRHPKIENQKTLSALKRIILGVAIVGVAYLSLVNLALNLPMTQHLINQHRPDKYAVHWERAWSWYPLRFHARGVSVDGQTSSQQYQADASEASASVSLLPLLAKTIRVYDVGAVNFAFRLRPRPRPGNEYGELAAFFPPIRDRDPEFPATPRKPWKEGATWQPARISQSPRTSSCSPPRATRSRATA
jgi:hypothetical protein